MNKYRDLKNEFIAIGSLPFDNIKDATLFVEKYGYNIPFCPQLSNFSKNEDMLLQFLEGMPEIMIKNEKIYVDSDVKSSIYEDFENVFEVKSSSYFDKYKITKSHSVLFEEFIKFIKKRKPKYAKIQITGPFSLSANVFDCNNRKVCFDKKAVDILTKILILKALWQIREIKFACSSTIPIVFIDEPSLCQIDNSEYEQLPDNDILENIKLMSNILKEHGAICGIHCCGECNWASLLHIGLDIIHFDTYMYENKLFSNPDSINKFLANNGKIAWGIVPTLNVEALEHMTISSLEHKFKTYKNILIENGVNKTLLENNSIISSSCGCATLSVNLTRKAFNLMKELSIKLKG